MTWQLKYKRLWIVCPLFVLFGVWLFYPPGSLFPEHYSILVYDKDNTLLRITLAEDGQYRFPIPEKPLPEKYKRALILYEDQRYYYHLGVDPLALGNAMYQNLRSGRRLRGGSTLAMQTARLSNPKERTYLNKLGECFHALRISIHTSREELLQLYAGHAPMGGNVVGVHAAAQLYFGKTVRELTWAEAALLVVLPNSPSMLNIEKKRRALLLKRDRLLRRLHNNGVFGETTLNLAIREPLPEARKQLPFHAPHFTTWALSNPVVGRILETTLDLNIQNQSRDLVGQYSRTLQAQGIENISALIAETQTGKIRAYIGSHDFFDQKNLGQVDGIQAFRSTGSLLKPFLAALALDRGPFTLQSVIQDVPTFYGTFSPQNASKDFRGLATLEQMLIESLNIPAVRLLNAYGIGDFYAFMKRGGLKNLFRPAAGYGLTMVIGGAEASLWELSQLYLSLANGGQHKTFIWKKTAHQIPPSVAGELYTPAAAWSVLHVLNQLTRPGSEFYWQYFNNRTPVAWKTGTSYGQRDAWAIGVNKQWTIGVWAGNFDGTGNAALGGATSAAPLLFMLFNHLNDPEKQMWFNRPEADFRDILCCRQSGFPAGQYCPDRLLISRPGKVQKYGTCPYHQRFLIDINSGKSVCSLCWENKKTVWQTRYIVPPLAKTILESQGHTVDNLPAHDISCPHHSDENRMQIVYPVDGIKILIPRDYDGKFEQIVFSARHLRDNARLFWFIDGEFIAETRGQHQITPAFLEYGRHRLTIQDREGFTRTVRFRTYNRLGTGSELRRHSGG